MPTIMQNFNPIVQTVYGMCITKVFDLLTLSQSSRRRGGDLLRTQIYHPAKFIALHLPLPQISLTKNLADTEASRPTPVIRTGVYHHMPIAVISQGHPK